MAETIVKDGQRYLRIGDKLLLIAADGTIKCKAKEVPNANGGQDVVVTVPCLKVKGR